MSKEKGRYNGREHDEYSVLNSLKKKNDVRVTGMLVQVLKREIWSERSECLIPNPSWRGDVGNGSWGKIDYLVNHCGYAKLSVGKFSF